MDRTSKAIRRALTEMPPKQAASAVRSFGLSPQEEACIIPIECTSPWNRKSLQQIAERLNVSKDTVDKMRSRAFRQIAGELRL